MNGVAGRAAGLVPAAGPTPVRRAVAGMALPVLTAVVVAAGIRGSGGAGMSAVAKVAFGLVLVWALSGALAARAKERTPQWQVAAGSLAAAITLSAARLAGQPGSSRPGAWHAVATIAGPLMIAISLHLLLALPDGRLAGRARRIGAGLGYAAAAGAGLGLALAGPPGPGLARRRWPGRPG